MLRSSLITLILSCLISSPFNALRSLTSLFQFFSHPFLCNTKICLSQTVQFLIDNSKRVPAPDPAFGIESFSGKRHLFRSAACTRRDSVSNHSTLVNSFLILNDYSYKAYNNLINYYRSRKHSIFIHFYTASHNHYIHISTA